MGVCQRPGILVCHQCVPVARRSRGVPLHCFVEVQTQLPSNPVARHGRPLSQIVANFSLKSDAHHWQRTHVVHHIDDGA
jgi:hypothetical protein